MEQGKIVLVNYTGKVLSTNEIFETTNEKKAIEAGIFQQGRKYLPGAIVIGEGEMLKEIEKTLEQMKTGEERKIVLKPEQAFGQRSQQLIAVVPLIEFKRKNMNPVPGMIIEINDRRGRVQSVSGGRVRVDFNHPLAGKEIEYEVKIEKELKEKNEQIEAFFEKYFGIIPESEKKLSIKEDKVEVALDAKYTQAIGPIKKIFSDAITKNIKGITSVKFTEEFKKEEEKEEAKTTEKKKKAKN